MGLGIFYLKKDQNLPPQTSLVSDEKIYLIKDLVLDQNIIDAVKDANLEHLGITQEEIQKLDKS